MLSRANYLKCNSHTWSWRAYKSGKLLEFWRVLGDDEELAGRGTGRRMWWSFRKHILKFQRLEVLSSAGYREFQRLPLLKRTYSGLNREIRGLVIGDWVGLSFTTVVRTMWQRTDATCSPWNILHIVNQMQLWKEGDKLESPPCG